MFENNNKKIIKKLSKKISSNNKGRNFIIVIAIILLTALLTIGLTAWFSSIKTRDNVDRDTDYYDYTPWEYTVGEGRLSKIIEGILLLDRSTSGLEVIDNIFFGENNLSIKEIKNLSYYDKNDINLLLGDYPKSRSEILIPSWVNDRFNISLINKEVTIRTFFDGYSDFSDYSSNTISTNYRICGIYEATEEESGDIFIGSIKITFNSLYIISVIIILIILSGYLLIYNIFYIHIINEFKFYGMLRVLGMKKSDIHKVVYNQVKNLAALAIPFGLIIGYKIGKIITPMIIRFIGNTEYITISNNINVFIFATILSLTTIYISTIKPSKLASEIKLTDTIKNEILVEKSYIKTTIRRSNRCKIKKIALINLFRYKKKTILTFASLGLSSIVLIVSLNGYLHLSPMIINSNLFSSDIKISHSGLTDRHTRFDAIDLEFVENIRKKDYVEDLDIGYEAILPSNDRYVSYGGLMPNEGKIKEEFLPYNYIAKKNFFNYLYPWLHYNTSSNLPVKIQGKGKNNLESSLKKYDLSSGRIDYDKFKSGDYLIAIDTQFFSVGEKVELSFIIVNSDGFEEIVKKQFEVMAVASSKGKSEASTIDLQKTIILNESNFKEIYGENSIFISEVLINFKDEINIENRVKDICNLAYKHSNKQINIESKYLINENVQELQLFFLRIGIIISLIVGLIGFVNLLNTVVTGLFSRKHEFLMYNAIGMTKKQLRTLILLESIYSAIISSITVIISGFLSVFIIDNLLPFKIKTSVNITIVSVIIVTIIMCIINIAIPILCYRYTVKNTKDLKDDIGL